jgi:transposase-like protein
MTNLLGFAKLSLDLVLSFKGTRRKDIRLTDQETKDKIERGIKILRSKGMSKREIARLMGYSREYLYEWTQEWGIDLK